MAEPIEFVTEHFWRQSSARQILFQVARLNDHTIAASGRELFANRQFGELFGRRDQSLGSQFSELIDQRFGNRDGCHVATLLVVQSTDKTAAK